MGVNIPPEQAFKADLLSYTTVKVVKTKMKLLCQLTVFLKIMSLVRNEHCYTGYSVTGSNRCAQGSKGRQGFGFLKVK